MLAVEFGIVRGRRPHQPHGDVPLSEEPESFLGTDSAGVVAVEHEVHAGGFKVLREPDDLLALGIGHPVGHDGEGGDSEGVEVDDIVEAFDEGQALFADELAVAGFGESAGVLAEEFLASVEAFWEAVFGGWFLPLAFGWGEGLPGLFLLFIGYIATDPGEDFSVLGQHWIEDVTSQ